MLIMAPFPNAESLQQIILKATSPSLSLDFETTESNKNNQPKSKKNLKSKCRDDFER